MQIWWHFTGHKQFKPEFITLEGLKPKWLSWRGIWQALKPQVWLGGV